MALFRAVVLEVWNSRVVETGALQAELEQRLSDLQRRESLLDEAYVYDRRIDAVT